MKKIQERIRKGEDVFERGFNIQKVNIDETYPEYIQQNLDKMKIWIG